MRQQRLVGGRLRLLFSASLKGCVFARNLVWSERREKIKLGAARSFGATVGEIDNLALSFSVDRGMRIIDEALQSFRKPVIAPRLLACAIHALLNDGPVAVVSDNEAVEVEIETILYSRAVNFRYQAAGLRKSGSIDTDTVAYGSQFLWPVSWMLAAPTADMNAEFIVERRQSAFERSNNARCNARGMPVHAHDGAERLKPKGICESSQQLVPTIVMNDAVGQDGTEPGHPVGQPPRNVAAV